MSAGTATTLKRVLQYPESLSSSENQLDPFPWYEQMRAENPVQYDERRQCWNVFRYDDVSRVLSDADVFTMEGASPTDLVNQLSDEAFDQSVGPSLLNSDPPEHTRLRRSVASHFTPRAVRDLSDGFERVTEEQLDRAFEAADNGEMDFMLDFARHLPVKIITEMLGVPIEDRDKFQKWGDEIVAAPSDTSEAGAEQAVEDQLAAVKNMYEYLMDLITERQENPRDDLITQIAQADELGPSEIIAFCTLLLMAGDKTAASFMSNALWTFSEEGILENVQNGDIPLEEVLPEVLRYRSPIGSTGRYTTQEVELAGTTIPADEMVVAWIGSANHDERMFDDPEVFKPGRNPSRHIAFGNGPHTCLGKHLANIEVKIALEAFFERVESVEVHVDEIAPIESSALFGLETMPISYRRA